MKNMPINRDPWDVRGQGPLFAVSEDHLPMSICVPLWPEFASLDALRAVYPECLDSDHPYYYRVWTVHSEGNGNWIQWSPGGESVVNVVGYLVSPLQIDQADDIVEEDLCDE